MERWTCSKEAGGTVGGGTVGGGIHRAGALPGLDGTAYALLSPQKSATPLYSIISKWRNPPPSPRSPPPNNTTPRFQKFPTPNSPITLRLYYHTTDSTTPRCRNPDVGIPASAHPPPLARQPTPRQAEKLIQNFPALRFPALDISAITPTLHRHAKETLTQSTEAASPDSAHCPNRRHSAQPQPG